MTAINPKAIERLRSGLRDVFAAAGTGQLPSAEDIEDLQQRGLVDADVTLVRDATARAVLFAAGGDRGAARREAVETTVEVIGRMKSRAADVDDQLDPRALAAKVSRP